MENTWNIISVVQPFSMPFKKTILLSALAFSLAAFCKNETPVPTATNPASVKLDANVIIDSIVVTKSKRTMQVYAKRKLLKTYNIGLGKDPVGHKHFEGDYKTPEGLYFINGKNGSSKYHKNLGISYPNKADIAYAAKMKKSAGGDVKIHGLPAGYKDEDYPNMPDWTWGCIAVTNANVDELYQHVKMGAKIFIKP